MEDTGLSGGPLVPHMEDTRLSGGLDAFIEQRKQMLREFRQVFVKRLPDMIANR